MKSFVALLLVAFLAVVLAAPNSSGSSGKGSRNGNGSSNSPVKNGMIGNMANAAATAGNEAKKWANGFFEFAGTGAKDLGNAVANAFEDGAKGLAKTFAAGMGNKKLGQKLSNMINTVGTDVKTLGDGGVNVLQGGATDLATLADRGVDALTNTVDGKNTMATTSKYSAFSR